MFLCHSFACPFLIEFSLSLPLSFYLLLCLSFSLSLSFSLLIPQQHLLLLCLFPASLSLVLLYLCLHAFKSILSSSITAHVLSLLLCLSFFYISAFMLPMSRIVHRQHLAISSVASLPFFESSVEPSYFWQRRGIKWKECRLARV